MAEDVTIEISVQRTTGAIEEHAQDRNWTVTRYVLSAVVISVTSNVDSDTVQWTENVVVTLEVLFEIEIDSLFFAQFLNKLINKSSPYFKF